MKAILILVSYQDTNVFQVTAGHVGVRLEHAIPHVCVDGPVEIQANHPARGDSAFQDNIAPPRVIPETRRLFSEPVIAESRCGPSLQRESPGQFAYLRPILA